MCLTCIGACQLVTDRRLAVNVIVRLTSAGGLLHVTLRAPAVKVLRFRNRRDRFGVKRVCEIRIKSQMLSFADAVQQPVCGDGGNIPTQS